MAAILPQGYTRSFTRLPTGGDSAHVCLCSVIGAYKDDRLWWLPGADELKNGIPSFIIVGSSPPGQEKLVRYPENRILKQLATVPKPIIASRRRIFL